METTADSALPQVLSPSESERHWAAIAHISALVLALLTTWMAGLAGLVAATVVYLVKRDDSVFVADHAREAVNFNLSMFMYAVAGGVLTLVLVGMTALTLGIGAIVTIPAGFLLLLAAVALGLMWLVCSIIAAVKAWNGETYRYPLTLRLIR